MESLSIEYDPSMSFSCDLGISLIIDCWMIIPNIYMEKFYGYRNQNVESSIESTQVSVLVGVIPERIILYHLRYSKIQRRYIVTHTIQL